MITLNNALRNVLRNPATYVGVMPALSLAATASGLVIPILVSPAEFGRYALVASVYQYLWLFDLGLSLLLSRRVPMMRRMGQFEASVEIIDNVKLLRLLILLLALVVLIPTLMYLNSSSTYLQLCFLSALLAAAGAHVLIGAVGILRAEDRVEAFTALQFANSFGLIGPRLLGLVLWQTAGSFTAMAFWNIILIWVFARAGVLRVSNRLSTVCSQLPSLLRASLPLFATSFLWAIFLTANRWGLVMHADDHTIGQFAFSANVITVIVGALSTALHVFYSRIVNTFGSASAFKYSWVVTRFICLGSTLAILLALVVNSSLIHLVEFALPKYQESMHAFRVMIAALPPILTCSFLVQIIILIGIKGNWFFNGGLLTSVILVTVGTSQLYDMGGISAAAIATPIASVVLTVFALTALIISGIIKVQHASLIALNVVLSTLFVLVLS